MRNGLRFVAVVAVLTFALGGPLAPLASAQQALSPDLIQERLKEAPPEHGVDAYDVGAGVLTAIRMPFNVGLCALGSLVGTVLFGLTVGSAQKGTTRIVEQGCSGPWITTGEDLRPQRVSDRFDYGQRSSMGRP